MKVAIHQPNHWPYLGFVQKMMMADIFLIFDDAQFVKGDFHHRNRIRNNSSEGYTWLTVPVEKRRIPLKDIKINNDLSIKNMHWYDYHRHTILDCYKKAPYMKEHVDFVNEVYDRKWTKLVDLNMYIINYLRDTFDIDTPMYRTSEMNIDFVSDESPADDENTTTHNEETLIKKRYRATKNIVEMCKSAGADTYISGSSGKDYMIESVLEGLGIKVEYQNFEHPAYNQVLKPFIPNLSFIDYIMNVDMASPISKIRIDKVTDVVKISIDTKIKS